MNNPDHSSAHGGDASTLANEVLGEHALASPISVPKKTLALWLAAAVIGGSLLGVAAMMISGHSRSQEEISRLEASVAKLAEENKAVQKQHNDLRTAYARMIAERRCEVIDGLDDCLAAGLRRPEHFAESDRQLLESRRPPEPAPEPAKGDNPAPAAKTTQMEATASGALPPAPSTAPARKLSLGEFAKELNKIPGVAVDGTAPGKAEAPADGKKGKKPAS